MAFRKFLSANLSNLGKELDHYTRFYDNILKLVDFNSDMTEEAVIECSEVYNFKDLVKATTCFRNPDKPTAIDLMLINSYLSFMRTSFIVTGLSIHEHEENLNSLINDREKTIDEIQTKLNETKPTQENHGNNINNVLTDHLLTKLINEGFNKIEENIDRLITEKLAKKSKEVEQTEANINEALDKNNSYADKLKNNLEVNNFATVIKTTKNNDLIQESERERRSANIIIYGISEVSDNTAKEYDETFVHSLLGIIGITSRSKQIIRLGKPIADKARPVKLVMNNSTDKDSIMSRLGNLKNAEEIYRKVSIRDDYTIEEREIIKESVKKAAQKNKEENTQSWKVRGTPKNGIRLVKITKRL